MSALRTSEPMSEPFWWDNRQLSHHFRGQSNAQLAERLDYLMKNPPQDTGVETGKPRDWHCLRRRVKCALCQQWIDWNDEATAISREQRRRKAAL